MVGIASGVAALDVKLKLKLAEDEPAAYLRSLATRRTHRLEQ
jgi:hypothetical protein